MQLSLRDLKNLWDSTLEFLQAVEALSGTTGYGLRSCLLQQAKAFLEHKCARAFFFFRRRTTL